MGSRAGLDRCGKSCPHRDSMPGPPSPLPVAIPTTLHGTLSLHINYVTFQKKLLLQVLNTQLKIHSLPQTFFRNPDHDQQHCYLHAPTVKPEAATVVVEFLMMGVRTPETS